MGSLTYTDDSERVESMNNNELIVPMALSIAVLF